MFNNYEKDSFVVVSDFNSNRRSFEKWQYKYLGRYDKIYILGNITNKVNSNGTGGLKMLIDAMELCEMYPGRVHYIPGNLDKLLYDYLYGDNNALYNLEQSGYENIIRELNELKKYNPTLFEDLFYFLGKCPIQVKLSFKGQKYSLAHAFFDQTLYNQKTNFCLKDFYYSSPFIRDRAKNVLYFRKDKDSYDYNDVVVDKSIVVIGNTSNRELNNLNIRNKYNEEVIVNCVNGTNYDGVMKKFDGEVHSPVDTKFDKNDSSDVDNYILDQEEKFKKCVVSFLKQNAGNSLYSYFYNYFKTGKPKELKEYLDTYGIDYRFMHIYLSSTRNKDKKNLTEEEVKDFVIGSGLEYTVTQLLIKYNFNVKTVINQFSGFYILKNFNYISNDNNARDVISHIGFNDIKKYFVNHKYTKVSEYINYVALKYKNKTK